MILETEPRTPETVPTQDNAAVLYRKAFALVDQLTEREKQILRSPSKVDPQPTAEEVETLLEKIDPMIVLLREAAALPACDWNLGHLSASTDFSHLGKADLLASAALWDSVQRLADEPREAVKNIQAAYHLGNSLQQGVISAMVNITIHQRAAALLAKHASTLPATEREVLLAENSTSYMWVAVRAAYESEAQFVVNSLRGLQDKYQNGYPLTKDDQEFIEALGSTPDAISKVMTSYQQLAAVLPDLLLWSDADFAQWEANFQKNASIPAVSAMTDVYTSTRLTSRRALVMDTMTNAGLAVLNGGIEELRHFPDPLTQEPFAHRLVDDHGSFELQSKILHKEKPITVTFSSSGP